MHHALIIIIALLARPALQAQTCDGLYYLTNNASTEFTTYDAKGGITGKSTGKVIEVKRNGQDLIAINQNIKYDQKGKVKEDSKATYSCNGNGLIIRFQLTGTDQKEGAISYPAVMKEGQELESNVSFSIDGVQKGKKMKVNFTISNRRIGGKDKVTTPVGSWTCHRITYDLDVRFKVMGITIPMKLEVIEWFAPGFGVVKTESWNKGKLEERSELTAFNK